MGRINMKEYKIGEIFFLDGKKYQVIEDDKLDCTNCCFKNIACWTLPLDACFNHYRKDKKNICFKLVEE